MTSSHRRFMQQSCKIRLFWRQQFAAHKTVGNLLTRRKLFPKMLLLPVNCSLFPRCSPEHSQLLMIPTSSLQEGPPLRSTADTLHGCSPLQLSAGFRAESSGWGGKVRPPTPPPPTVLLYTHNTNKLWCSWSKAFQVKINSLFIDGQRGMLRVASMTPSCLLERPVKTTLHAAMISYCSNQWHTKSVY